MNKRQKTEDSAWYHSYLYFREIDYAKTLITYNAFKCIKKHVQIISDDKKDFPVIRI